MRLVRQHDSRYQAIIRYVQQPTWRRTRLSRVRLQTALHLVRFSCNARDVHLLRGLDAEAVAGAAAYHDRQIMATVAAITGFLEVRAGEELGHVPLERFKPEFVRGWKQACLPFTSGGLNFREWARYADAAHIGKWALVVRSARDSVTGVDHFPIVARELEVATNGGRPMPAAWSECVVGTSRAAWSLNRAWHRMRDLAIATHASDKMPWWLRATRGDVARVEHVGDRSQRMVSKTTTLHLLQEYSNGVRGEPVAQFVLKTAAAAGASGWTAQPWQEDGDLTLHDVNIIVCFCLRLGLPVPETWQGRNTGALISNNRGWDVLGGGWDRTGTAPTIGGIAATTTSSACYVR